MLAASRGLVFEAMAGRLLRARADGESPQVRRALAATRSELAAMIVNGPRDEPLADYHSRLLTLRRQRDQQERRLAEIAAQLRPPQAGSARRPSDRAGPMSELLQTLPSGEALVAFARYEDGSQPGRADDAYLALAADGGMCAPVVIPLGPAAEIDTLVAHWRREVGRKVRGIEAAARLERDCWDAGCRLREAVWDPLATAFAGATKVYLVPDGALGLVDFERLPVSRAGLRFLIETGPVVRYLMRERDLRVALNDDAETTPAGRGLLCIGGPEYNLPVSSRHEPVVRRPWSHATPCLASVRGRFIPLPASKLEAEDVYSWWRAHGLGDAIVLTGASASESAVSRLAPGRRVLHLATHGFLLDWNCLGFDSGQPGGGILARARAPETAVDLGTVGQENPLLFSGLAFAGANNDSDGPLAGDDGILTAEEVVGMDLAGVETVVLSACDGGGGVPVHGEGTIGLRRAFQLAGARTVVMSLGLVRDTTTRAWMRSFYEGLLDLGRSPAAAARRASLESLIACRQAGVSLHPMNWGGFVAVGE